MARDDFDWLEMWENLLDMFSDRETHVYKSKSKKGGWYLKEGPASKGKQGKTLGWTGFFRKK